MKSNRFSHWVRRQIEYRPIQELIGIPLLCLMFFAAIIVPQTQAGFDTTGVYFDTQTTTVEAIVAPSQFRWPNTTFGISQYFSGRHPGIDLTNPKDTPVYPISEGKVISVTSLYNGYGKHVIVEHQGSLSSLYAHLSKIEVKEGQMVNKSTKLGTVGRTGWATGNHLHLEIHENGISVNPMEILPDIKQYHDDLISELEVNSIKPDFKEIL